MIYDIEYSLQRKEKHDIVLVNPSAAYEIVWHRGLLPKATIKTILDVKVVKFIMLPIQDRSFQLQKSSCERNRNHKLTNGLL